MEDLDPVINFAPTMLGPSPVAVHQAICFQDFPVLTLMNAVQMEDWGHVTSCASTQMAPFPVDAYLDTSISSLNTAVLI